MVLETARLDDPDTSMTVAFAVWDVTYVNKRKFGPDYQTKHRSYSQCMHRTFFRPLLMLLKLQPPSNESGGSSRKDANFAHSEAFREADIAGRRKFLDPFMVTIKFTSRSLALILIISDEASILLCVSGVWKGQRGIGSPCLFLRVPWASNCIWLRNLLIWEQSLFRLRRRREYSVTTHELCPGDAF
jgi:hypothetical protein